MSIDAVTTGMVRGGGEDNKQNTYRSNPFQQKQIAQPRARIVHASLCCSLFWISHLRPSCGILKLAFAAALHCVLFFFLYGHTGFCPTLCGDYFEGPSFQIIGCLHHLSAVSLFSRDLCYPLLKARIRGQPLGAAWHHLNERRHDRPHLTTPERF